MFWNVREELSDFLSEEVIRELHVTTCQQETCRGRKRAAQMLVNGLDCKERQAEKVGERRAKREGGIRKLIDLKVGSPVKGP